MTGAKGRGAPSPFAMPAAGWWQSVKRAWSQAGVDNVSLAAAGVSFYAFLALVPLLGAIVLSYGLIAAPGTVLREMKGLTTVMPGDAAKLIGDQLMNVVKTSGSKKGFGLALALVLALFSARGAASSVITGLNIVNEVKETRSFIRLNALALGITLAGVIGAIVALIAVAALGHLQKLFPGFPGAVLILGKIASYALVAGGGAAAAASLYRYAPDRPNARWVWFTPGSLGAALLWMVLTIVFGIYVANFGNYNATYGSLGAVVVMLTWLYLSSYILLLGAELNVELEHQAEGAEGDKPKDKATAPGGLSADQNAAQSSSDKPSGIAPFMASRVASRANAAAGGAKLSLTSSALATFGLAALKRRGGTGRGVAMLAIAAGLSLLRRPRR